MRKVLIIGGGFGVAIAALLLAGCAEHTVDTKVETVTVEKRVTEPCLVAPVRPVYAYGQGPKPDHAEEARRLAADFEKAEQYGLAWEVASIGCRISGGTSPPSALPASGSSRTP